MAKFTDCTASLADAIEALEAGAAGYTLPSRQQVSKKDLAALRKALAPTPKRAAN